jgi:probable phosphoglycerate mutase
MARELRQMRFTLPPGAARLLLVRHGETTPLTDGIPVPLLEGASNPDLDPVGVVEARRLAERLARLPIAAIYVTPLVRTHQTAAPLAERLGLRPRVEPRLAEIRLGEWEGGGMRRAVEDGDPRALRLIAEQRWELAPGAEHTDAFAARVRAGVEAIAAAHPDETVVSVSHAGTIGQLVCAALGGGPLTFAPDNASITELVVAPERWILRRFNDVAHLEGA